MDTPRGVMDTPDTPTAQESVMKIVIRELVCPEFYVDTWASEGHLRTEDEGGEFRIAADDGVCRLMKSELAEDAVHESGRSFICRCGVRFLEHEGKTVVLWR